ncbi:MAG: transposase [Lachnospiraceae bacterium]|nr:transposase [Lachnospiraceae bacterium]
MPRHSRIKSKTNIYHVMSRGSNKQLLFDDETDCLRYLQLLNDIKKEYGIKVYAYCLMSNHVHIILKDDNEMLSTAIRRLNSRYAMYYNRKKGYR